MPPKTADRYIKAEPEDLTWIQGFLDRACSVSVPKRCIEVTTTWETGLRSIYYVLLVVGIKAKIRKRKAGGWVLRISGLHNIRKWAQVGFRDPKKQAMLEKILDLG